MDYSHVVVGGGAVGLAIGSRLARAGRRVLIIEKNAELGRETSSRNSEVIHAGLYYPRESLKSKLCIRGKQLIYEAHRRNHLSEVSQCGKWIVAQTPGEASYLEKLRLRAQDIGVPVEYVPLDLAKEAEPAVIAREAVLNSPTTGIVSAHALMNLSEGRFTESGGDIALLSEVVGIERIDASSSYKVRCRSQGEDVDISADVVINAAGLWAPRIAAMVGLNFTPYYAKGNYFSYPVAKPRVSRLVYPAPSDYGSLGTHLTIDLAGGIRFGPDFEWVDSPTDYRVDSTNLNAAKAAISQYIDIDTSALVPDYSGIRPKLSKDTSVFQDFVIEEGPPGFLNLAGIESPGLTASLAIGEYVENLVG